MYRFTYPDRQHHTLHTTFGAIYRCLCEQGSFETDERAGRLQTVCSPNVEEHVLHEIENNPGTSSSQVACLHGVSQMRLSVPYMTTTIIPITSNVCRDYHKRIFLHRKDSFAGFCNRSSPLWDFCLRSSAPMKRPLVVMASFTCIIVIYGL